MPGRDASRCVVPGGAWCQQGDFGRAAVQSGCRWRGSTSSHLGKRQVAPSVSRSLPPSRYHRPPPTHLSHSASLSGSATLALSCSAQRDAACRAWGRAWAVGTCAGSSEHGEHTHTHVHTRAHIARRCARARCLLVARLLGAEQVGAAKAEAHAQRREVAAQRGERPAPAPLVHLHRARASSRGSHAHCRCTHTRRTR